MLRRIVCTFAVIVGGAALAYFTWAAHRIGGDALRERGWPRAFPYPDRWLLALNNYYDAKHPAAGGSIKMHGELGRVMRDVTWASWAGAAVCLAGLVALLLPVMLRCLRRGRRGFEVIVGAESSEGRIGG